MILADTEQREPSLAQKVTTNRGALLSDTEPKRNGAASRYHALHIIFFVSMWHRHHSWLLPWLLYPSHCFVMLNPLSFKLSVARWVCCAIVSGIPNFCSEADLFCIQFIYLPHFFRTVIKWNEFSADRKWFDLHMSSLLSAVEEEFKVFGDFPGSVQSLCCLHLCVKDCHFFRNISYHECNFLYQVWFTYVPIVV